MGKRKSSKYKKRNTKNRYMGFKALLSVMLVVFALATANISFLSFARDVFAVTLTKDLELESIRKAGLSGINSIKEVFLYEKGEEADIINSLPPEMLLPETE